MSIDNILQAIQIKNYQSILNNDEVRNSFVSFIIIQIRVSFKLLSLPPLLSSFFHKVGLHFLMKLKLILIVIFIGE